MKHFAALMAKCFIGKVARKRFELIFGIFNYPFPKLFLTDL